MTLVKSKQDILALQQPWTPRDGGVVHLHLQPLGTPELPGGADFSVGENVISYLQPLRSTGPPPAYDSSQGRLRVPVPAKVLWRTSTSKDREGKWRASHHHRSQICNTAPPGHGCSSNATLPPPCRVPESGREGMHSF